MAHIRESANEFHLSIYLCQKENFKILVLNNPFLNVNAMKY